MITFKKILTKPFRIAYHAFLKIIPKKKSRICFQSFHGQYSDSPKYISQSMHELNDKLDIIWIMQEGPNDLPPYVKAIPLNPESFLQKRIRDWYIHTTNIFVGNGLGRNVVFLKEKSPKAKRSFKKSKILIQLSRQYCYTTWHGTPLKKIIRDSIGNEMYDGSVWRTELFMGNEHTARIMGNILFNKMPIKMVGTPRNDILFTDSQKRKSSIKTKFGIPVDKKVCLFAPTFRADGVDTDNMNVYRSGAKQLEMIDIDKLIERLHSKFGGEWAFVLRIHYSVDQMVDWDYFYSHYPDKIINGNQGDMAEYLYITDVLMTDASSSMFDFAITERPCFLFFPDLDHYKEEERGMYLDPETLPFPISRDFDTLLDCIDTLDEKNYVKQVKLMKEQLGYVEDGNAAHRIAEYILTKHGLLKQATRIAHKS